MESGRGVRWGSRSAGAGRGRRGPQTGGSLRGNAPRPATLRSADGWARPARGSSGVLWGWRAAGRLHTGWNGWSRRGVSQSPRAKGQGAGKKSPCASGKGLLVLNRGRKSTEMCTRPHRGLSCPGTGLPGARDPRSHTPRSRKFTALWPLSWGRLSSRDQILAQKIHPQVGNKGTDHASWRGQLLTSA